MGKQLAIIGCPGDSTFAQSAGSAYVYANEYNVWEMTYKMYGKGQEYDAFGCAVDIYDNILLSGALLGDGVV